VIKKTDEQIASISKILSGSFLFAALDEKSARVVIDAMSEVTLTKGDRVIKQGDDGDFLFIIDRGECECYKTFPDQPEEVMVKKCVPGDVFGELALLYNMPRAASVQATDITVCWRLDRETFNHIVKKAAMESRELKQDTLKRVPLLGNMDDYERGQLSDALFPKTFEEGSDIVTQGEDGNAFYILEEGTAVAVKDGKDVMDYTDGMFFGELALLKNEPRAATVRATSKCKVLALDRKAFNRLLDPTKVLFNVDYK